MDEQLKKRRQRGEAALAAVWGYKPEGEDRDSAAADCLSDVLTALIGPAGHFNGDDVALDQDAGHAARALLDRGYASWAGDAEDYSEPDTVTVTIPAIEPEQLLAEPAPIAIRNTGKIEAGAGAPVLVELTGTRFAVRQFIAAHWGEEEAANHLV